VSGPPWTRPELAALERLRAPADIQEFLDAIPYSTDPFYRSPRKVLSDRVAHCFDGAVFAAAALRRLGHEPLLLDMRAVRDDDHVIALFSRHGRFGAVAKSNFAGLRYREPVYRDPRELVMSYFEAYFNVDREKTLRSYSRPLRLRGFDAEGWEVRDEIMARIAERLDRLRHTPLLTAAQVRTLTLVDERSATAGMVGLDPAGLYRPADETR
jgi:hypothetical protein